MDAEDNFETMPTIELGITASNGAGILQNQYTHFSYEVTDSCLFRKQLLLLGWDHSFKVPPYGKQELNQEKILFILRIMLLLMTSGVLERAIQLFQNLE
jgi:hypothetical protein